MCTALQPLTKMTKNDWDLEAANATYNVEGWGNRLFSSQRGSATWYAKPLQEDGGDIDNSLKW